MTSKLKCPFCQTELRKLFNRYTGEPNCDYECGNCDCDLYGIEIPETVWQALIQAKQDLEIARKSLEEIKMCCADEWIYIAANKALEQIEHKEQI